MTSTKNAARMGNRNLGEGLADPGLEVVGPGVGHGSDVFHAERRGDVAGDRVAVHEQHSLVLADLQHGRDVDRDGRLAGRPPLGLNTMTIWPRRVSAGASAASRDSVSMIGPWPASVGTSARISIASTRQRSDSAE